MAHDMDDGDPPKPPRKVGFKCPPPRREGEVRNPFGRSGRPKPQPDFLDGVITLEVNGEPVRMTRDAAIDHFLFSKASKGDVQAIKTLDERRRRREQTAGAAEPHVLSPDEEKAFDDFVRRQARRLGRGGGS